MLSQPVVLFWDASRSAYENAPGSLLKSQCFICCSVSLFRWNRDQNGTRPVARQVDGHRSGNPPLETPLEHPGSLCIELDAAGYGAQVHALRQRGTLRSLQDV